MIKTFHDLSPAVSPEPAGPAPLFPEAVQVRDIADPAARARIEDTARRLEMADFQFLDVEISRVRQLEETIRLDDPLYISEYATEISQFSEQILNRLTEITQLRHMEMVRHHLLNILACVRRVDPATLLNPGVGARLRALFGSVVLDREGFTQLERDLTAAVAACLQQLVLLKKTQQLFVDLFDKNELQFRGLTIHVLAGELRLEDERASIADTETGADSDLFVRQGLIDRRDAMERFERRLHTLKVLRQTVLLRIGQLRLEQKNMHTLIDQTDETINLVIPVWKQQVMALLAAGPSESRAELHAQLEATQRLLTKQMSSLEQESS